MKKFLLFLSALSITAYAVAGPANLSNGYYRITNHHTDRYIYVLDNTGELLVSQGTADMMAIALYKGLDDAISDPASVLYLEKHDPKYDIQAQGTGIYQMVGQYLGIIESPRQQGSYWAYGTKAGVSLYLHDADDDLSEYESYLTTTGNANSPTRNWDIHQISSDSENYFGIKPSISAQGKKYHPFYADFPFSFASSGMKAYYVTKVDEKNGLVIYKEVNGTVPRCTPVIVECQSENTSGNKLNLGGNASAINDNLLKGVFFQYFEYKHENFVEYDKKSMRLLGVMADGSLGMVTSDAKYVPRNGFYLPVSANAPAQLKLVNQQEYEDIVGKEPVAVTSVTLNTTSLTLTIGDAQTLTATVGPADATDKTVTWSSSNTAVATVDQTGKVTAVGVGTANIYAKAGEITATCAVTVKGIDATSITLSQTSVDLTVGQTATITATVAPDNTTDKTVLWTSSNTSVATVNGGVITAIAPGTATITAKCGNVQATCQVNVSGVAVTSVTLNKTSLELTVGDSETLTATVAPDNATDKSVTWASSNTAVATVDQNGKVTAVAAGTATITAKAGEKTATCAVTVKNIEIYYNLSLNTSTVCLQIGESFDIVATVDTNDPNPEDVVWSSSDPSVVIVDDGGHVEALKLGEAVITVRCSYATATCTVTVSDVKPTEIRLSKTSMILTIGDKEIIYASILPENAPHGTIVWSTSNAAVATVSQNGVVTAVGMGEANITATCGDIEASCHVTVNPVFAASIELNALDLDLVVGEMFELTATVLPENTTDKTVVWITSDTNVATVDIYGKVKAVAPGNATITAACGMVMATCAVSVHGVDAVEIILDKTEVELKAEETVTLTATVYPDNTTDKTVVWTSSDDTVATVNAEGVVTGIDKGTAEITATCGTAKAVCKVTVTTEGGINDVIVDAQDPADVYNVMGIKVKSNTTDLSDLAPGIYIVNGVKYIVR